MRFALQSLICSVCFACGGLHAQTNGWVSLFNGKDFSGWKPMHGANFVVTNGCLLLKDGRGWLRTDRQFANFMLEFEWRALKPGYDSGVFLRAAVEGQPWPENAWQVNLSSSALGALVKGTRTIVPAENPPAKVNQWTKCALTATNRALKLEVNGEEAWTFDKFDAPPGFIGLQAEDSPFEFRNIRIRELQ